MLVGHVLKLREVPAYRDAIIFLGIESNYGGALSANRIAAVFQPNLLDGPQVAYHRELTGGRKLGLIYIYNKDMDGGGDAGLWTGEVQKQGAAEQLLISLRRDNLRFAKHFVTQDKKGPEAIQRKILDQMKKFRKQPKPLTDPNFQTPKFTYTGKTNGGKDDLIICKQLNGYWRAVLQNSGEYRRVCDRLGVQRM